MANLRPPAASCMRVVSPQKCSLFPRISQNHGISSHSLTRLPPLASVDHQGAVIFCASCRQCNSATSQSVSGQVTTSEGKSTGKEVQKIKRDEDPSEQTFAKGLPQVYALGWVKHGIWSLFSGLGSFATNIPTRLAGEINRFGWRSDKAASATVNNAEKLKVIWPLQEETLPKAANGRSKKTVTNQKKVHSFSESPVQEQNTFEKAMQDTHLSIASFYSSSAPEEGAKPQELKQEPNAAEKDKNVAKDEQSWNVFRQFSFPIPFLESGSEQEAKKKPLIKKDFISRAALEERTRALVAGVNIAVSVPSKLKRVEELCKHIIDHPSMAALARKEKIIPTLLRMTKAKSKPLRDLSYEALALLGYVFPVKGRGVRILSLDGGGTRGLVTLECLSKIEQISGKSIYELFDYVCGVSTGALIAAVICLYRLPLKECRRLYEEFSRLMFTRSRVVGTSGLVWNHAFYSTEQWEKILQDEMGHKLMVEFARDPLVPKMSAVSNLMNTPRMKNFLFRNYNLPPDTYSQYPGSCTNCLWEVIRASSAAPGYYEPFILEEYVHMDGGLMTNNPTALAVHESRLLWPGENVHCVVSLGTGRYEPTVETAPTKLSLKDKVTKVVDSATDTEGVHMIMTDLMRPSSYFRFNPYLSEEITLDEIRDEKFVLMQQDAQMYLRKNEQKVQRAVEILKQGRSPQQKISDWLKETGDLH